MRPNPDPLAYSPTEAAAVIGVSRAFLYKLIQRGEIRTVTLGARRLIPRSSLLDLLGESEAGGELPRPAAAQRPTLGTIRGTARRSASGGER